MYDTINSFTEVIATGVKEQDLGGGGDVASTNSINLGKANITFVGGKGQVLKARVVETFTTGDGATSLDIKLESDTETTFSTALKDVATYNILLASLVAGALVINQQIPVQKYQQFLRAYFNAIGGTWTAGKLIVWLDDVPETAEAQLDLVDPA
jgi:hypothetical protein